MLPPLDLTGALLLRHPTFLQQGTSPQRRECSTEMSESAEGLNVDWHVKLNRARHHLKELEGRLSISCRSTRIQLNVVPVPRNTTSSTRFIKRHQYRVTCPS